MSGRPFQQDPIDEGEEGFLEELREFSDIDEILRQQRNILRDIRILLEQSDLGSTTTTIDIGESQIEVEREPRQVHRFDSRVDLTNEAVEEEIGIPAEAESVTIHVDDAGDDFNVSVFFLDDTSGELTERDQSDSSIYSGGSGNDVFVNDEVASPFVKVEIADAGTSSENKVDYTILAS